MGTFYILRKKGKADSENGKENEADGRGCAGVILVAMEILFLIMFLIWYFTK